MARSIAATASASSEDHKRTYLCPVERAVDVIGGRWKAVILFELMASTRRFGELHRRLPGITQHTLTQQLRELEADGVVHRHVYAQVPPKVEYSLTDQGRTLKPILIALRDWGEAQLVEANSLQPITTTDVATRGVAKE